MSINTKKSFLDIDQIHHGDSSVEMLKIEPDSVSLSFWSPPYFVGKHYEKEATFESWQLLLQQVIHNHFKILKPGGYMVINIANILAFKDASMPKFQALNISNQRSPITREMVLDAKQQNPEFSKHDLAKLLNCSEQTIDRRLNGNNIRGGKYNTQTRVKLVGHYLEKYAHEVGLYLYDHRIWVKDPAWANSKWSSNSYRSVDEFEDLYIFQKPGESIVDKNKLTSNDWKEWGSRAIWYIKSVRKNDDHAAKFPKELAEKVIKLFSDIDDIVLDPFMGSGTTALAAIENNRHFIGIEKEKAYVELSAKNISKLLKRPTLI